MTRLARIVLNGTRTEDLDPITLDAFLDDGLRVVQAFPTSGWMGSLKTGHDVLPFIFFPKGTFDFGSYFEDDERYGQTNVHTKRLDVGEYVTMTDENGEHCYSVKQVFWLDELSGSML
jgi:hypothetical protein